MNPEIRKLLEAAREIEDLPTRQLAIGSIITKIFVDAGHNAPVLVGGMAVSVYTQGLYRSMDLDFISHLPNPDEFMRELGYVHKGKDFFSEELASLVEFPTPTDPPSKEKCRVMIVPETNLPIYVIGVEDLILDRANSFSATGSQQCYEWAFKLMSVFYAHIDWSYLHRKSHQLGILEKVNRLQRTVKGNLKQLGLLGNKQTLATEEVGTRKMTHMKLF